MNHSAANQKQHHRDSDLTLLTQCMPVVLLYLDSGDEMVVLVLYVSVCCAGALLRISVCDCDIIICRNTFARITLKMDVSKCFWDTVYR